MKTVWSAQGITTGRLVHSLALDQNLVSFPTASKANRLYIVGFRCGDSGNSYHLVSLADGMECFSSATQEELAQKMNEDNFHPLSGADKDKVINLLADVALAVR